jgi:hypothetical protein
MNPFLALITPLGDGPVTPPTQPPLGIWGPTDPRPTLPIAGWNPGTGAWPTPPVQPPQPPLGIWGPGDPRPTLPIAGWNPGTGTFPPGVQPPQPPLVIWGPGDPRPTLPISGWDPGTGAFPKPPEGGGGPQPTVEMKAAWSPQTGWTTVFVVTPAEDALVPTPSTTDASQN